MLTKTELKTIKAARKILKKLSKKAYIWERKLSELYDGDDPDKAIDEQMKFNDWVDDIYKLARISFLTGNDIKIEV